MRTLLIASAGLVLTASGAADAQRTAGRPGASYDVPGRTMQAPMANPKRPGPITARPLDVNATLSTPSVQTGPNQTARWGSKVGGRWWAGANAPGGWGGYRRPYSGWAVPPYWNAPRFHVDDWSTYGLARPLPGYTWVRYYDDAVLINARGSVFDSVAGVDWDRDGGSGYIDQYVDALPQDDRVFAGRDDRRQPGAAYDAPEYRRGPEPRGETAAIGYATDTRRGAWRRDLPPPPPMASVGYGADYPPPPEYGRAGGGTWTSPDGNTTVTTTTSGGNYYPGGSTTVTVQSAPVVTTTTTTEYYDDSATYRPTKRRRRAR